MREEHLEGEQALIWAVEEDDDPSSRAPLPEWIAQPIERFVMNFADEKSKFDKLRARRASEGRGLTPAQQQQYQKFCESSERKLLFDKVHKTNVTKLRANADMRNVAKTMFSLQVSIIGPNYEEMRIKTGSGDEHRLVLLRGEPVESPLPAGLDDGLDDSVPEALMHGEQQRIPIFDDGEEPDLEVLDQEAALEAEAEDQDEAEIWANTSDEDAVMEIESALPAKHLARVKNFDHREAFVKLTARGLTMLPTHKSGVFLSYHKTSKTWQGYYPNCDKQMAFTFGGVKGRNLTAIRHSKFVQLLRA